MEVGLGDGRDIVVMHGTSESRFGDQQDVDQDLYPKSSQETK